MIYKTYWNFTEACISGSLVNIWLNRIARPTFPQTSIGSTKQQNRTTEIDITLIAYGNVELFTYTSFYGKNINHPQIAYKSWKFCISCYMNESCTSSSLSYIWNESFKMRSPLLVLLKVERNGMKCFVIIIVWIFQFSIAYKIAIKCNFLAIATLKATNMWN